MSSTQSLYTNALSFYLFNYYTKFPIFGLKIIFNFSILVSFWTCKFTKWAFLSISADLMGIFVIYQQFFDPFFEYSTEFLLFKKN